VSGEATAKGTTKQSPSQSFAVLEIRFYRDKSIGRTTLVSAGKVYFVGVHFVVKLQADNHVRWDVAPCGLNRKQKTQTG
jgi:hypothetical protein